MKQYAVIGLGQFGKKVAETLTELGADVLVLDKNPSIIETMKDRVTSAVCVDVTDEKSLMETGISEVDAVVVALGEQVEASILVTAILKKLGVKRIISRAHSDLHAQVLKIIGAEQTIDPEEEMGRRLAREIFAPEVHARIMLSTGQEILEINAPKIFHGKTLQSLDFRAKYKLNCIAIKTRVPNVDRSGEVTYEYEVNKLPRAQDVINDGDILVLLGDEKMIREFLSLVE